MAFLQNLFGKFLVLYLCTKRMMAKEVRIEILEKKWVHKGRNHFSFGSTHPSTCRSRKGIYLIYSLQIWKCLKSRSPEIGLVCILFPIWWLLNHISAIRTWRKNLEGRAAQWSGEEQILFTRVFQRAKSMCSVGSGKVKNTGAEGRPSCSSPCPY